MIIANIIYTLISIPVSLHYLGTEKFGIWALVTQITGYMMLLEFGMSGASARHLSKCKDEINDGKYGSVIITSFKVYLYQGIGVLLIGFVVGMFGASFFNIPYTLRSDFRYVIFIQTVITFATLVARAPAAVLWCHQRHDIINVTGTICLIISIFALIACYKLGFGIYSIPITHFITFIASFTIAIYFANKNGYFPRRKNWGQYDKKIFHELFHCGSGLFIMNIGMQMISASQVLMLAKILGVEVAAIWSVGTKMYVLMQQIVTRVYNTCEPSFAEMIARGELVTLKKRASDMLLLSNTITAFGSIALICMNQSLIRVWLGDKIEWNANYNYILGLLLFASCVTKSHLGLSTLGATLHKQKWLCVIEGGLFISIGSIATNLYGIYGMLVTSLLLNISVSGLLSTLNVCRVLGDKISIIIKWIISPIILIFAFSLVKYSIESVFKCLNANQSLIVNLTITLISLPVAWYFLLSVQIKDELRCRICSMIQPIFDLVCRFGNITGRK